VRTSTALIATATLAGLALTAAPSAEAGKRKLKKPITRISGEEVAEMLQGLGQVELQTDDYGDPLVTVKGRLNFIVQFYECNDDGCSTLQFRTWWRKDGPWDPNKLFVYSQNKRKGRVYIDSDGDAALETLVVLEGGVSRLHIMTRRDDFLSASQEFMQSVVAERQ